MSAIARLLAALTAVLTAALALQATAQPFDYPETATVEQVDTYHGTEVADPYRWLEQDVRESKAVADWVERQNTLTFSYLDSLQQRDTIEQRLTELWNYERYSPPVRHGDWYYYFHNNGLQNQAVLYRAKEPGGPSEVVLDPNRWSDDGTVALGDAVFSYSGRYLAYSIQESGSDWRSWRIRDLVSGATLPDELTWIKFSRVAWAADDSGFYYSRYPRPEAGQEFQSLNTDMAVYFHRLGTVEVDDRRIHSRPDHPEWGFNAYTTENGHFLFLLTWWGTDDRYRVEYIDLRKPDRGVVTLEDEFHSDYQLIEAVGDSAWFLTTDSAPRGRIVKLDLSRPGEPDWQEVVPEQAHVLTDASLVGGRLVLQYLQDAHALVTVHDLSGKRLRQVALPGIGRASGFATAPNDKITYFSYSSLNRPATIYRYGVDSGETAAVLAPELAFEPEDFVVKQVFYPSRDGTRVPLFIAHKKGLKLTGDTPTLLYGYGGFKVSLTPGFSVTRLAWMDMGHVFAMANLRGGGEYGDAWHRAGIKLHKQNVFDDFIAAAEFLVAQDYTRPDRLAVMGGSNGGLLVGAVINQRPDLFGAALPAVGVMDMLRFHLFTAGRFWTDDYGSAENPEEFAALYAYSPYHNIRAADYPAVLVTTADTDDRVVPGHSFKYIARLQEKHTGDAPVLIRIQTKAGHGSGKPTAMLIREYADMWAFLVANLSGD